MAAAFTLIIETSTPRASVAVAMADGSIEQHEFSSDRNHNSALFAPLQKLLEAQRPLLPGLVIVGSGPGSYSGTRVGIAAAQGVAIAAGCGVVAMPSILAVDSVRKSGRGLAIGDARRDSFWTAEIKDAALAEAPLLTDLSGLEQAVAIAIADGTAVFCFEDPDRFPLPAEMRVHVKTALPDASRLWQAWEASSVAARERWAALTPEPIYLKPPHITPAKKGSQGAAV